MIEARCPICAKSIVKTDAKHRPFCSARCRTIDLGRWLGESYSIPDDDASVPPDGDDDADPG